MDLLRPEPKPEKPMSHPLPLNSVADAAGSFAAQVRSIAACRVEAKVASHDGMPLLCAVEAVFGSLLPRPTAQELVWLSISPRAGAHALHLQAFGADNKLLVEAFHEFEA
jgi:hypothetical protein